MKIMKVSELLIQQLLYRIRSSKNTELLSGMGVRSDLAAQGVIRVKVPMPPQTAPCLHHFGRRGHWDTQGLNVHFLHCICSCI